MTGRRPPYQDGVMKMMKTDVKEVLVLGAGGFIGSHMVRRLAEEGRRVRGADLALPRYRETAADEFMIGDLREPAFCRAVFDRRFDEVYQFAADMGGAGYVFSGKHDADIMRNSTAINLNVLEACREKGAGRLFFASSACVYPQGAQLDPDNPDCREETAYPADPDSEYGWEKLFAERLYLAHARNYGLEVRIARYHNIFGPEGAWGNGREKSPAAICRKVAEAEDGGEIEIWGDGRQTRSFLYIDECLEGTLRLVRSAFSGPLNIGSEEMVSINQLVGLVCGVAGKKLSIRHAPGPLGVRGRRSDNGAIRRALGWTPSWPLRAGLDRTYAWIAERVASGDADA